MPLTLDEQPHAVAIDGCETETLPTRPLCAPDQLGDPGEALRAAADVDPTTLADGLPDFGPSVLPQHSL